MMVEIKRVLRPGGVLIISSPDKKEYSILPNYRNPFHVRELFKEEFEDLIRAYFKNLTLLSQRIVYGSGIFPDTGAFQITGYDINDTSCGRHGLAHPLYLILIASGEAVPILSGGLIEQRVAESGIVKNYALEQLKMSEDIAQLGEKVRPLEEQLHTQGSEAGEKVRRLEEQPHALGSEAGEKVRRLLHQLESQSSQSADNVRQLDMQVEHLEPELQSLAGTLCGSCAIK